MFFFFCYEKWHMVCLVICMCVCVCVQFDLSINNSYSKVSWKKEMMSKVIFNYVRTRPRRSERNLYPIWFLFTNLKQLNEFAVWFDMTYWDHIDFASNKMFFLCVYVCVCVSVWREWLFFNIFFVEKSHPNLIVIKWRSIWLKILTKIKIKSFM